MEQFLSICSQRKLPACPQLARAGSPPQARREGAVAGGRSGEKQASRSRPGRAGPGRPTWPPPSASEADAQLWMARIRAPCGMGGWAGGGWRRGTACRAWGRERCRRGRRGQLGTEAVHFILPRGRLRKTRVQGPRASYALPEATATRPRLPPTRHCCRGHRVWGAAGCSLSRPPVSRCPSDAICVLPGAPAPVSEGASIPGYRGPELRPRAS